MSSTRLISRSLLTTFRHSLTSSSSSSSTAFKQSLRPLSHFRSLVPAALTRVFSTRPATTSLSDPNPNWSNRPPKETILLDGCDFEHWLVVVDKPEGDATRDDIIEGYIKTLAKVVGSEEEARMKIYSVSTRHYFAFGALVSEELSYKLKELPGVRWVLPDSYLDVKNKDYGGEPFINGQAVPYDPKYHEEWVRNNARANERNRKNDRPRNFDRSRNFERRDAQGPPPPPRPNMGGPPQGNMGPNMGGPPQGNMGPNMGGHPQGNMGPNMGGHPQGNMGPNMGGPPMGGMPPRMPPNNMGGPPMGGMPPRMPPNNMGGQPNYNAGPNMGGMPPQGGGMPPNNMGNPPNYNAGPNMGGYPNNQQNPNYGNGPINGGAPFQSGPNPNQNNFAPNNANPYQNQNLPGRDYQ